MHKKWREHIKFITEHIDTKTPDEIAEEIGVPAYNLKLFLLQNRIFPAQTARNLLLEILTLKFVKPDYFMPTKQFYRETGIRQRRFWQLYRGERKLTEIEYQNLVLHFNVSLDDAFEVRQLSLLEDVYFRKG